MTYLSQCHYYEKKSRSGKHGEGRYRLGLTGNHEILLSHKLEVSITLMRQHCSDSEESDKCRLGWTSRQIKSCANHGSCRNALMALFAITAERCANLDLRPDLTNVPLTKLGQAHLAIKTSHRFFIIRSYLHFHTNPASTHQVIWTLWLSTIQSCVHLS